MAANIFVKVALAVCFFIAIVLEPPGAVGKGMEFRAPIFLGSAIFVPIIAKVRQWDPYPHTADALLAAPFLLDTCLLYTSPSPRDLSTSRMPSSA